jgi:hypothetical protein
MLAAAVRLKVRLTGSGPRLVKRKHGYRRSRADFGSLVSHSPREIRFDTVCEVIGAPRTAAQRAFLAASARQHIVGGPFRRFQFFELAHRA